LSSLKRFPINAIKIDRSFVGDITNDTNAEAIVRAIIAMAHSLKMKVVAEGVETREQLAFLQSQHCDEMQGFFYSPPVTDSKFTKLLEKRFIEH
jgi:EAL domain-containing protein (putative c-di-GMP-specific phosphodiesterase class I)